MEAIAIGDLHFGGPIAKLIDHHEQVIIRELNSAVDYARNKGIQQVFLLGDTGHTPRMTYECQIAFLDWLRSVKDLQVHCILGNHDMFSDDPSSGHSLQLISKVAPKNFHLYTEPKTVLIEGSEVRFLPWPSVDFKKHMLNVAHIERKGAVSDNGREFRGNLSDGKEVAVIGHLHTCQKVRNSYYPGTLYQTDFGQQVKKYYAHVQYTSDSDYDISFIRHSQQIKLRTVTVSCKSDLSKLTKDPSELVRIVLADNFKADAINLNKYNNVVKVSGSTADVADLSDGIDLTLSTEDFLVAFLKTQNVDRSLKKRAMHIWGTL